MFYIEKVLEYSMITEQNLCVQCYEPITNPVCEECHTKHVETWLQDQELTRGKKAEILAEIKRALPEEAMNENVCILCGKRTLSTCSYCFFLVSAKAIKKAGIINTTLRNFLETFNYRQEHEEYMI